jgi:DNA-binding SARP family transcriptional activator/predicted ATPase
MFFLHFFRGARIEGEGGVVTGAAAQRHRLALLAVLAVAHPGGVSRDKAIGYLWPERDGGHARNLLNQAIHALRRALGADAILSVGDDLRLDVSVVKPDVVAFVEALEAGHAEQAVALYTGPFLDGFFIAGSIEFERWLIETRERFARAYAQTLERLAQEAAVSEQFGASVEWWRRRLAFDPYSERAVLSLMQALEAAGDRGTAIRRAREHAALLRDELGAEPNPEVEAMAERMRTEPGSILAPAPRWAMPERAIRESFLPSPAYDLIGRHAELSRLREAWWASESDGPHFVCIVGEAGVGKTRLAEELLDRASRDGISVARARSYSSEGRLAYGPVVAWLRSPALRTTLGGLDPVWLGELARLLPELLSGHPGLSPPLATESGQRERFFRALAHAVSPVGESRLLLIDDLQWCDRETLHWLHYLLRFDHGARLLVAGTLRSGEIESDHPAWRLLLDLRAQGQLIEIALEPLGEGETTELAAQVAARELQAKVATELFRETEGNPLFVIETVRAWLVDEGRSSWVRPAKSSVLTEPLATREPSLPPRVQAVIRSRLAGMSPSGQEIAELAATIGREFSFQVLARAWQRDEKELAAGLDELLQRRIVRAHGVSAYDFTHDKLREVAYAEIGLARRRLLHRRVAEALGAVHPSSFVDVSGQLAVHYERAGLPRLAVALYERAGDAAKRVYANEEAILCFNRALAQRETLTEDVDGDVQELTLRIALGDSLVAARGWAAAEIEEVYTRALELGESGDIIHLSRALWGLQGYHMVRSESAKAYALGERLLHLAQERNDSALLVPAHFVQGLSLFHLGDFVRAREHLDRAIALHTPAHQPTHDFPFTGDLGVLSLSIASHARWHLGQPDQGLEMSRGALSMAEDLGHPFSRTFAHAYAAMMHQFRQEWRATETHAEATIALSSEYHFPYYLAWGTILEGWTIASRGACERGLEQMEEGLTALLGTGARLRRPYYLALLAGGYGDSGRVGEGLGRVEEALAAVETTGERWCEAELHRLRGELRLADDGNEHEAAISLHRAIDVARSQNAAGLQLRAAVDLGRLQQRQGETEGARRTLERNLGRFREGSDSADLRTARTLLEELRA